MLSNQGSEAWLSDRAGHVTASRFADVLDVGANGKPKKARDDYMMKLVAERITGQASDSATSAAMAWGHDAEPFARTAYETQTGRIVTESNFLRHPTMKWVGASPDGLIGADGGYESKCPHNSAVHLRTIRDGIPLEHTAQVQGCMLVSGRAWWDFISFDPRMPPDLRLYVQRIPRDDVYINALQNKLADFLAEVQVEVNAFLLKGKAA